MKKIVLILSFCMILSGCTTSNEDPTNIELAVLKSSLLEKELHIDDLRNSIDELQETISSLETDIDQLTIELNEGYEMRQKLMEGQPQDLGYVDSKNNYFRIIDNHLFALYHFEDRTLDYAYESLFRVTEDDNFVREKEIYRGIDIQYELDPYYELIALSDNNEIIVFTFLGKELYREELSGKLDLQGDIIRTMLTNRQITEVIPPEEIEELDDSQGTDDSPVDETSDHSGNLNAESTTNESDSSDSLEEVVNTRTTYITDIFFLVTKDKGNETFFVGVYHLSYDGNTYKLYYIQGDEEQYIEPYFYNNRLYYQSVNDGKIMEFDLYSDAVYDEELEGTEESSE